MLVPFSPLASSVHARAPLQITFLWYDSSLPLLLAGQAFFVPADCIVELHSKETKLIDFRHYSIRLQPIGVSRRIRKIVQSHKVPDLRNLQDVSDFVTRLDFSNFTHI